MPPCFERCSSHPNDLSSKHDSCPNAAAEPCTCSHGGHNNNNNKDKKTRSVSAPPEPFQETWTDDRVDNTLLMYGYDDSSLGHTNSPHQSSYSSAKDTDDWFLPADPESCSWRLGNELLQQAVPERDAVASPFAWRDSNSAAVAARSSNKIQNNNKRTTETGQGGNGDETILALQARGVRGGGLVKAAEAAASTVQFIIRPQPVKTTAPTAASAGTLLVVPQARTAARSIEDDHRFDNKIVEEESGILQSPTITTAEDQEATAHQQQQQENKSNNSLKTATTTAVDSKKPPPPPKPSLSEPWCKQATDQSKKEEQQKLLRKEKAEERQRKLQQLQCEFPASSSASNRDDFLQDRTKMPPTSGDGDPHDQNNGEEAAVHENTPQVTQRDNRQLQHQHQHHRHHRSTPAAAAAAAGGARTGRGGGGGGRVPAGDHHGGSAAATRRATEDNEDGVVGTTAVVAAAATPTPTSIHPPTPLFERLVTEEVQELKAYARIIESQNRRLAELEHAHGDLETRLQVESRSRQKLEATLESREREWSYRLEQLESDRDHWKKRVDEEQTKNDRLMEEIMRKEQEIRRMLQRKYDHETSRSIRGARGMHSERPEKSSHHHATTSRSPELHRANFQSPHEILRESGSADMARLRNTRGLLLDFFGM